MSETLQRPTPQITVEPISPNDLKEALTGSNGNPSYEQQFGITSASLGTSGYPANPTLAELELQAKLAEARAMNPLAFSEASFTGGQPTFGTDVAAMQMELEKFKQLYGQSENEKGAARKREQQLMEAFNGLMTQYESIQNQPTSQGQWGQPPVPQTQFAQSNFQPIGDPFEGLEDGSYVEGKMLKNFARSLANPVLESAASIQVANQRISALERSLLNQVRTNAGITKVDEFMYVAQKPWLRNLNEADRIQAIAAFKQAEGPTSPQFAPPQQLQAVADAQNRIANKLTYVEGNVPQVADTSVAAIEAAKQRDYAIAMQQNPDDGSRARALRAVANKYGDNLGQNPSDLSR